jgi:hypothetical protein
MADATTADDDLLYSICAAMIEAIETYYGLPDVPDDATLPDRRYVSDGLPAYDVDQLTAHVTRTVSLDDRGQESANFPLGPLVWRSVEVIITLLRYSPVVDTDGVDDVVIPSEAVIETSARRVLGDAERVPDAILQAYREGLLLPAACNGVFHAGWQQYGPEGGIVGGINTFRLRLQ